MGACAVLRITNQDALSEDLENDPFLNSALQRFTCELYYRLGSFLVPLSIGLITRRHYLSEHNKNRGTSGDNEDKQNSSTSSKLGSGYEVIESFICMGMVGFCFGIGVMLAVTTVNNLEYCIEELISRK